MSRPNTFTLLSPTTNTEPGTNPNDGSIPFSYLNIQHDDCREPNSDQNIDLEKIQCTFAHPFATPGKQLNISTPYQSPFAPYNLGSAKDNEHK
jgi:hypothetical protein